METPDEIRARYRYKDVAELRGLLASPSLTDTERRVISALLEKREQGAARVARATVDASRLPPIMGTAGVLSLLVGLWFLLVAPGNPGGELMGAQLVNFQRLYIGQTASIVGAILIAAEWRPRARV